MSDTNKLAQDITRKSGIQTYLIIKLLADQKLVNNAFKAYAYFRWVDDQIDKNLKSAEEQKIFFDKQKNIIDTAYKSKSLTNLCPEEMMVEEIILQDTTPSSKLKSYIYNFLAIIEFDIARRNKLVDTGELEWYSDTIGKAVTDCIQYFIGNNQTYPDSPDQYKAATAAHIIHALRDMKEDIKVGYFNVPKEFYKDKIDEWIENRILLARQYFQEGKIYINKIPNWRCRLAAYLYCWRFEPLLRVIKKEF